MAGVAPVPDERFLDESAGRSGTEIAARYSFDYCGLKVGSIFGTDAQLKSSISDGVVMVVLGVGATGAVKDFT